jgi:hypothetical protein
MYPNSELITRSYSAFKAGDHESMARCYSDGPRFSDSVFTDLDHDRVRAKAATQLARFQAEETRAGGYVRHE